MKGIIKLKNPIMIDGTPISELSYDTDKIGVDEYLKALNLAVAKGNGITGANLKIDSGAHLALGMYAIIADNPKYDITDIERVKGQDLIKIVDIGMSFTIGREESMEEPSEAQSEITPNSITPIFSASEE